MKKWLLNLINAKKAQAEAMRKQVAGSDNIEEVRALGETLMALQKEIADAEKQLAELEKDDGEGGTEPPAGDEGRSAAPAAGETRSASFNPMATYGGEARAEVDADDPTNSIEYRNAFMAFAMSGTPIPAELRADANTTTADVGAVIPTVLINRIVEKAESVGMILPLVNKTNYAAGVEIPVSTLKPVATWVAEGASSDRQKLTASKVSFTHHKLRCEVSMSMEVGTMALSAFEGKLVEQVARAMVKAKENAVFNGTGTGQPKGILSETPEAGQAISLTSGTGLSYEFLCECEAAIPEEYEAGAKWFMSKKSFMAFVGMVDANGQPVARVNYGIGGKPERTLLGREVITTGTYLPNFVAAPTADTTFACIVDMSDYVLNSVYDMGIQRKQDWDTEDMLTKAVTACDGKLTDKGSLVTVTVKNAS